VGVAGHIPWHKVDLPLRATRSIWLATTGADDRPRATPVWFWWDGRDLYFVTNRRGRKSRDLKKQPWVVAHLGDGDDVIIIEGPTERLVDSAQLARFRAAYAAKYVDPHSGAQAPIDNKGDECYRLRPARILTWEYGVAATRTEWRFEDPGAEPPAVPSELLQVSTDDP
jgi:hypothetical protein